MLRCAICDDTQEEGSDFVDRPHSRMRVQHSDHYGEYLCYACEQEIDENKVELEEGDEEE